MLGRPIENDRTGVGRLAKAVCDTDLWPPYAASLWHMTNELSASRNTAMKSERSCAVNSGTSQSRLWASIIGTSARQEFARLCARSVFGATQLALQSSRLRNFYHVPM